jgi:hypothetical protein
MAWVPGAQSHNKSWPEYLSSLFAIAIEADWQAETKQYNKIK